MACGNHVDKECGIPPVLLRVLTSTVSAHAALRRTNARTAQPFSTFQQALLLLLDNTFQLGSRRTIRPPIAEPRGPE